MNRFKFKNGALVQSLGIHGCLTTLILLAILLLRPEVKIATAIDVEILAKTLKEIGSTRPQSFARHANVKPSKPSIDLRPSFMKDGSLYAKSPQVSGANPVGRGTSEFSTTQEILQKPLAVISAFDHLASQINRNLDYPILLVENSVQGTASLDLRFDRDGNISESESEFLGSERHVRGLLVKASRMGLLEWNKSDAYRLHKDEFKGQHFHANFEVSYLEADLSQVSKNGADTYKMTRRRFKDVSCGAPISPDLICIALKAKGAVENLLNDNSRIKLDLLKDRLESYDDLGLNGINQLIHES
jgi:hypothetical protein